MTDITLNLVIKFIEANFETSPDFFYSEDAALGYEIITETRDDIYYNAAVEIFEEGYIKVVIEQYTGDNDVLVTRNEYQVTTLKELKKILHPIM